ncbi:hypothetical protein MKX03_014251 [Papaver bracteatum]|nr:hypothetical protein MKX03_014251 [Papaver bracteatum]
MQMNSMPPRAPPPWFAVVPLPPDPLLNSSFWKAENVRNHLKKLQETADLAKAISESAGEVNNANLDPSVIKISQVIKEKSANSEVQELLSVEAANSLLLNLKSQIEPLGTFSSQTSQWEEKFVAVEKMKEIAKAKANDERKTLDFVSIWHFLPDEDDKFLEGVRAVLEEEEHQADLSADTHAAKVAIATAEESRKAIRNVEPELKDDSHDIDGAVAEEVRET